MVPSRSIVINRQSDRLDIAVIGAGLAGSCLAGALARRGIQVALIDTQAGHVSERRDFRAEKFGARQMALFEGLGFGPTLVAHTTATKEVAVIRYGRLAYREVACEWGAPYPVLVRAVRDALPEGLLRPVRVADLDLGPERQVLSLSDGRQIEARLVVLATGLGQALHAKAGLSRRVLSPRHSLAVGFDMAAPRDSFPFPALTYFSERFGGRDAYLTLFPLGHVMRANLFCYRDPGDTWVADLRRDPAATLRATMPRLPAACPDLAVAGPLEIRPIDLVRTEEVERDGLVVIGDAFQTACPIPGTGVGKLLTDVDRLANVHVPAWLATPGMGRDKIAAFYGDLVKKACDAESLRLSRYARSLAVESGAVWRARRLRNRVARTAAYAARDGWKAVASVAHALMLAGS
ncbi:FAD-dependent oxidoreductase [Methylobacterium sp. NPDC080182]|uniref:FAD-dependent oxidoreductase n=1 Tax=Methylobacterium sp. NPDC080182 TaxID=3390590 RepID=UPI003D01FBB6